VLERGARRSQSYVNEKLMQGASGLADALIEMQKD
jgi:hypothetical protein